MRRATQRIRAVVFDLDDTLYRERDYVRSGFAAVGAFLRKKLGRSEPLAEWMWRQFNLGRRDNVFDAADANFSLGLGPEGIAELLEVYRAHRPDITPCPGVRDVLATLAHKGLKLGLLTDGRLPAQRLKLEALGLEEFFQAVVFTEEVGPQAWKPSTEGFELIKTKLASPHAACVYVADNLEKDFLAPNRLGWLTVRWRRPGQVYEDRAAPQGGRPQKTVRNGSELVRLLQDPRVRQRPT